MTRAERRKQERLANRPAGMGGYGSERTTTTMMDQQTKAAGAAVAVALAPKGDDFRPVYTKHFMIVFDPGDKRETIPATYQVFRLTDLATSTAGEPAPVYGWDTLREAEEFAGKMDVVVEWAIKQEHLKAAIDAGTIIPIDFLSSEYATAQADAEGVNEE